MELLTPQNLESSSDLQSTQPTLIQKPCFECHNVTRAESLPIINIFLPSNAIYIYIYSLFNYFLGTGTAKINYLLYQ